MNNNNTDPIISLFTQKVRETSSQWKKAAKWRRWATNVSQAQAQNDE